MQTPSFIATEIANLERRFDGPFHDFERWNACRPQGGSIYTPHQIKEARDYLTAIGSREALEVRKHWEAIP